MQFLKQETNIQFMSKRRLAAVFSIILILTSITSLALQGLNFGIDFTGGTMIELGYQEEADLNKLRNDLSQGGYPDAGEESRRESGRLPVFSSSRTSRSSETGPRHRRRNGAWHGF